MLRIICSIPESSIEELKLVDGITIENSVVDFVDEPEDADEDNEG